MGSARFSSVCVVTIFDVSDDAGTPYISSFILGIEKGSCSKDTTLSSEYAIDSEDF